MYIYSITAAAKQLQASTNCFWIIDVCSQVFLNSLFIGIITQPQVTDSDCLCYLKYILVLNISNICCLGIKLFM